MRAAWRSYLERYNGGRGVVLIGHSQGTFVLRRLIAEEIDRRPKVRRRLVSALLLGGNVLVRKGRDSGGDFEHVRACRSDRQVGCVVAFSTFNAPVPSDALFGRTTEPGLEVLCTNPAALGGGEGPVDAIFPSAPFAPGTAIAFAIDATGFPRPDDRGHVALVPRQLLGPLLVGGRRRRAPDRAARRRAGAEPDAGRDLGRAPGRREHRAREPGAARPPPGGGVRPRAPLTGFIPRSSGAWEACGTCAC